MNIQEQTASEIKRAALDMGKVAAGTARHITETTFNTSVLLINLLRTVAQNGKADVISGETTLDKMQGLVEKGDFLSSVAVADEDIEFYKSAMQKEKMAYVVLDVNNDDCKNIIYLNSDTEKLKNIISLHHARAGIMNEIEPTVFLRHIEDKNIGAIRNLNDTEFELFREIAQEKDLVFSFYRKDDRVTVLYNLQDKSIVSDTLNTMSWDMTDKHAASIRNKLIIKRSNRHELVNAIEGNEDFYAVNAKDSGNYLTITSEGLSYYKNNNEIVKISREDKYFADKAKEKFLGIQNPVLLSRAEFEARPVEREQTIQNRYNIYSDDIAEAVKKSHEHLNNVIAKMSLDDENENPSQIFDDSVSYSGYAWYEKLTDSEREELEAYMEKLSDSECEELESHIERFSEYRSKVEIKEIPVKDRILDNIIREAERSRTEVNSKNKHAAIYNVNTRARSLKYEDSRRNKADI
ncbi:MAG: hypothetical protein J1F01_00665 [Oscillospiraceae bacterium]|nr:hypothetical protein [Oscillospiraceae bacterium]